MCRSRVATRGWGDVEAEPGEIAGVVVSELVAEFDGSVRGIVAHGSWVHGDFATGRSDLDLLVVLQRDPSPDLVARVEPILSRIVEANTAWRDRLELGFVTRQAVEDVLRGSKTPHQAARTSAGEPLQLVRATRQRVLDGDTARRGISLYGPPPPELLPSIPAAIVRAVVREHLQAWPTWVEHVEADDPATYGFQAYAVLTVSRGAALLAGERLSKRQAARWATTRYPQWDGWIRWAEAWWYGGGSDDDPPPGDGRSVHQFVAAVTDSREER